MSETLTKQATEPKYATKPFDIEGMPPGIPYIVGNEAAERFSFYGMRTILFIFMTQYLMQVGGDERAVMTDSDAKFWVHTFIVAAYFFPIAGAILSDWLWGKYKTILWLSIVYCLGHLALALDESRIGLTVGLTLIAMGTGAIKPCVSAHVGDQFGSRNKHLLTRVFGWFYLAINLGAFTSTLLTPKLLEWYGPHVAFGVPGLLMLIATIVFWMGRNTFVHIPPKGEAFLKESFGEEGRSVIFRLVPIYVFVAVFWCLFDQTASAWIQQAELMDREFLGIEWLSSQLQAVNPFFILVLVPAFAYFLYPGLNRFFALTPLRKIAIGLFVTVLAFSVSAYIESRITGGRVVLHRFDTKGKGLDSTSTADPAQFGADNLLDGKTSGDAPGWVSRLRKDQEKAEEFFPQRIAIQLRDRSAWTIDTIRIFMNSDMASYEEYINDQEDITESSPASRYHPKDVKFYSGESSVGPWKPVGEMTVAQDASVSEIQFPETSAEYVLVEIQSNWGADAVSLGEVKVLASGELSPEMASTATSFEHAERVWPNVAAAGFKPNIGWQILAYFILTAAEVMVSITALEFSYTQAPNSMKSVIMSLYLLSVAAGNEFTAIVNWVIGNEDGTSKLPGARYYWFFTVCMLAAAIGFLYVMQTYRGKTYIQDDEDAEVSDENIESEADAEGTEH
jgi:POT family proton-dependent oligopeptide transporter